MADWGSRKTIAEMKQISTNLGRKFIEKLDHNTWSMEDTSEEYAIYIRYHNTDIVKVIPGYGFYCYTGGWFTTTTKDRLNKFAPIGNFYSDKGEWYVSTLNGDYPFTEGCLIKFDGTVKYNKEEVDDKKYLRKQLRKYIQELKKRDRLPYPSLGDCFICKSEETSCLRSHLEETYIHGSLVYNAMRYCGRPPQFISASFSINNWNLDLVYNDVRKYFKRHLGL